MKKPKPARWQRDFAAWRAGHKSGFIFGLQWAVTKTKEQCREQLVVETGVPVHPGNQK